jgi:pyrrolysine biosynthesis protein PylD
MTRLQSDDISGIASQLKAYDEGLLVKTGHNLRQIACHAMELEEEDVRGLVSGMRVGIVPIRWGQGVIDGFCEATAGILRHLGFDTFVTGNSDISGLAEAYETKADAVFLSDDNDFVALNAQTRQYVHNAQATGKGFAAGLDLMTGGLADQKVLVLGCGAVGRSATLTLLNYGATVSIYDNNSRYSREFISSFYAPDSNRITIEADFHEALAGHSLVVDATNAAEIIHAEDISPQTFIAAPGMPLGLSRDALNKVSDRLLHDPLQIGVATMGMGVVRQMSNDEERHKKRISNIEC